MEKLKETPEFIVWDDGRVEYKPGTVEHNRQQITDRARQARARMRQIAAAPSFTAAQRDQAIKDVAKVCANVIPLLLGEITDSGDA